MSVPKIDNGFFIIKNFIFILFERQGDREISPIANLLPKYLQQPQLGQAEAEI